MSELSWPERQRLKGGDLQDRLRGWAGTPVALGDENRGWDWSLCREAADRIAELEAENERLREAFGLFFDLHCSSYFL